MDPVSAVLITKNEVRSVERCLRSLAGIADEILVVDSGSTDGTVAACEALGARVVHQDWLGFGPQKNRANALAAHDWILSLDADEALDEPLRAAILQAKQAGLSGAYASARLNWFYGRWIRHGFEYPDRKVRLFHRGQASWDDALVHESLRLAPGTTITRLPGQLLHRACERFPDHVAKVAHYSALAAQHRLSRGRRPSALGIVFSPLVTFFRAYVVKRGFLDGLHGFVLAAMHAQAALLKQVRLWDLHREARQRPDAPAP
ncbi:MAG: glycosyltransferase family 2 protein [Anaeromyxobacter sp.]